MTNPIEYYIKALLYQHECVVIPQFGAFLTRYFSAEINPGTQLFSPPSKRVAFNRSITENDGLLAQYVAKAEGLPYTEALEKIKKTVKGWRQLLANQQKLHLKGVGHLYYNSQKLLQFSPALDYNYNVDAYGLNIFRATAMEREQQIKSSVNRAIEQKSSNTESPKNKKEPKKSNRGWIAWAAILGPVVAIALYSYYYPERIESAAGYVTNVFKTESSTSTTNKAGEQVNSAAADEALGVESQAISPAEKSAYDVEDAPVESDLENATEENSSKQETTNGSDMTASQPEKETLNNSAESTSQDVLASNADIEAMKKAKYQIIVGSFSTQQNAEQYVTNLTARGYTAYKAGNVGNYTRVAVGGKGSKQDALAMLQKVRQEVNYQAWLNVN
jgi:cell division septation protein DedD/nucleoid DNA-binding protein